MIEKLARLHLMWRKQDNITISQNNAIEENASLRTKNEKQQKEIKWMALKLLELGEISANKYSILTGVDRLESRKMADEFELKR